MENNNIKKEENLKLLYRQRNFLDSERIKLANSFDKYLLSFATGSLYLSIIFINAISDNLISKNILGWGWIALIFSIIFTLLSIFLSEKAFKEDIKIIDKSIENVINNKDVGEEKNCWNTAITVINIIGTFAFIVGVITLSRFYFINIGIN